MIPMASYVYGTSARKVAPMPQQPEQQTKEVSQRVRQNRSRALHMNRGYVVFLAVAAAFALIACVNYLQLQAEITNRSYNITALQQELADRKEANTTKYNVVINSMNLEEIRDKAMNEFGMVYASPEQVIEYRSPEEASVKQYSGIPDSGIVASSDVIK